MKYNEFIAKWRGKKIAVIGDMVADVAVTGIASRISREAPVLIIDEQARVVLPGGAANVVMNLKAMGAEPIPIGILGCDAEGDQLLDAFIAAGLNYNFIVDSRVRHTTTKTRIFSQGHNTVKQQVLRIDKGNTCPVGKKTIEKLKESLNQALRVADAFIVSDYGEGVMCPEIIQEILNINKKGVYVFVDSRYQLYQYVGVTALTPNEKELEEACAPILDRNQDDNLDEAAQHLQNYLGCRDLLVKRGKNGMALFQERNLNSIRVPAYGVTEVADVTGAGDTVLAAYSLAIVSGATPVQAMEIANIAGGIKVTKAGTAVVTAEELEKAQC